MIRKKKKIQLHRVHSSFLVVATVRNLACLTGLGLALSVLLHHLLPYVDAVLIHLAFLGSQCLGRWFDMTLLSHWGFPGDSESKESACSAGNPGSIPGLGKSPGEGNGNPLQCSCLDSPMDRGAWNVTVHGAAKSWTQLSD